MINRNRKRGNIVAHIEYHFKMFDCEKNINYSVTDIHLNNYRLVEGENEELNHNIINSNAES